VTNSGTNSAAVFNFGIPKGEKGDTGDVRFCAFDINMDTGILSMSYSQDVEYDFHINENGELEVTFSGS